MTFWSNVNLKEIVPDYDKRISRRVGIFLDENCKFISSYEESKVGDTIVRQISSQGYEKEESELLITRRSEQNYKLTNTRGTHILHDELFINGPSKNIETFVKELEEEFKEEPEE